MWKIFFYILEGGIILLNLKLICQWYKERIFLVCMIHCILQSLFFWIIYNWSSNINVSQCTDFHCLGLRLVFIMEYFHFLYYQIYLFSNSQRKWNINFLCIVVLNLSSTLTLLSRKILSYLLFVTLLTFTLTVYTTFFSNIFV